MDPPGVWSKEDQMPGGSEHPKCFFSSQQIPRTPDPLWANNGAESTFTLSTTWHNTPKLSDQYGSDKNIRIEKRQSLVQMNLFLA